MKVVRPLPATVFACVSLLTAATASAQPLQLTDANRGKVTAFFLQNGIGSVVTNAPYSADVVSTVTQVLADGTRIEQTVNGKVYRDSAGRMRREQQVLGLSGIVSRGAAPVNTITITDPTTRTTYTIDDATRTARKLRYSAVLEFNANQWSRPYVTWFGDLNGDTGLAAVRLRLLEADLAAVAARADRQTALQRPGDGLRSGAGGRGARSGSPAPDAQGSESIGSRQMEGVLVNGTRFTQTIPTGQIGNDRPIVITDETWISPDLQVLVYSKHHDPRTGDVEYRLRNISRNEPPANLFLVPGGYTVVDPQTTAVPGLRSGGGRGPAPTPTTTTPRPPGQ